MCREIQQTPVRDTAHLSELFALPQFHLVGGQQQQTLVPLIVAVY